MNRSARRKAKKLINKAIAQGIVPKKLPPSNQKLSHILSDYKDNYVAPQEFQRPLSWKNENKLKYFVSLLYNRTEGSLIVVNVELALEFLKDQTSPSSECYKQMNDAIKLFERTLEEGKQWIVLDGNNRLAFIIALLSDEYRIPAGEYTYIKADDTTGHFIVSRGSDTFADLPKVVRDTILNRLQVVSEYTHIDWYGMSATFINVNMMVAPNDQELRNAQVSDYSRWVNKLRKDNINLLGMIFKDPIGRYVGDEWIVDCLVMDILCIQPTEEPVTFRYSDGTDRQINQGRNGARSYTANVTCSALSQAQKNALYDKEMTDDASFYEAKFTHLSDYISQMVDKASSKSEKSALKVKSLVQNLFWMMCNGIDTYYQAVEAVRLHQKAYADSTITYGKDEATFKNACSGLSGGNIEFRYIILNGIIDEVLGQTVVEDVNLSNPFKYDEEGNEIEEEVLTV